MIISVHVPSCGGTSFRRILEDIYNKKLQVCYLNISLPSDLEKLNIEKNIEIIHGHFLANSFDRIYPNAKLITWVRHPVERIISRYYHFKRIPDNNNICSSILNKNNLNLCQFVELEGMKNNITQYFSKKNINDFSFIGIVEQWDKSISKVSKILNWPCGVNDYKENKNPDNINEKYNISKKEYDYIVNLNRQDMELYEKVYGLL